MIFTTHMKKYIFAIVLVVIGVWGLQTVISDKHNSEIVIGVIAPLSGPIAPYGEEIRKGVSEVTPPGIKVIYEDEACDPKTAIAAFKKLTELDKATVIIGPACGAPQKAIAPLVKQSRAVVITPSAAPEELFSLSGGYMFDIQYSLEQESTFMAKKMHELGYKNVAVITYKNAFSEVHEKTFRANYAGTILSTVSLDENSTSIDTDLLKLSQKKFDAIFVADISFFFAGGIDKLKKNRIAVPVFSTYVVELPIARSLVNGVIYSFPKDIIGSDGGTYALSKDTAATLFPIVDKCKGNANCVRKELLATGDFNESGVKKREITLKRIIGETTELYEK